MSGVPGPPHENGEDRDNPTLSDEEIEKALQIAFEVRNPRDVRKDSEAMNALRGRFEEIAPWPGDKTLTQAKAIALLLAMSESLKPATQISRGLATVDHPAIELLDELIDALADLQRKTPNDFFAIEGRPANRALGLKQLRQDEALLGLVELIKQMENVSTKEAERRVEKSMRRRGQRRMNKPITQKTLQSLRRHRKAKKPIALLEYELFYKSRLE
jgi:hypothetical protein